MSTPATASLGRDLGVAIVLALAGAAALAALAPWTGSAGATRAVIAALGLAYALYIVGASGERVGRMTTLALWTIAAAFVWLADWPLVAYALVHVGLVWLVRSLYCYAGPVPALADLCLCLFGAAFAAWAAQRSGSAWLSIWCFFLLQSLRTLIPTSIGVTRGETRNVTDDAFARAHRNAESAIRRLSAAC